MSEDFTRKSGLTPAGPRPGSSSSVPQAGSGPRDPRAGVIAPVRYRYESIIDFIESQSMNISRSGMFVATTNAVSPGSTIEFEFGLTDGFALLRGTAEVVRISQTPPGMGVRYLQVDDASRKLIDRIVDINTREGRRPTVALELTDPSSLRDLRGLAGATPVSSGVSFTGRDLRVEMNPATVGYFIYNPLLNIRLGGFVVPAEEDVPLGTVFSVVIEDLQGVTLWAGKGKVVAKHESRLGIRLVDADKATLARLQMEINKFAPTKPGGE